MHRADDERMRARRKGKVRRRGDRQVAGSGSRAQRWCHVVDIARFRGQATPYLTHERERVVLERAVAGNNMTWARNLAKFVKCS
jgi:hypothetical protein